MKVSLILFSLDISIPNFQYFAAATFNGSKTKNSLPGSAPPPSKSPHRLQQQSDDDRLWRLIREAIDTIR